MRRFTVVPNHEDARGTITDLITGQGCVDAVTIVRTRKGAVRGNHLHARTRQFAHVVSGRLFVTDGENEFELGPGDTIIDEPGEPHAWRAVEDTVCVVFVQGPRAGEDYESDTVRLSGDDKLIHEEPRCVTLPAPRIPRRCRWFGHQWLRPADKGAESAGQAGYWDWCCKRDGCEARKLPC